MFDRDKVKVGDILLYREKKNDWLGAVINFFTLGNKKYCHAARYIGQGVVAEAHMGAKYGPMKIKSDDQKYIDIFRVKAFRTGLSGNQQHLYMQETEKMYGSDYDTVGLVGTIRSTLGKILGFSWLRQSEPWLNDAGKYFCSEAESVLWKRMTHLTEWIWGRVDIAPQVSDAATTPNDLGRSKALFKVC